MKDPQKKKRSRNHEAEKHNLQIRSMKRLYIQNTMEDVLKKDPYSNISLFEEMMNQPDSQIDSIKADQLQQQLQSIKNSLLSQNQSYQQEDIKSPSHEVMQRNRRSVQKDIFILNSKDQEEILPEGDALENIYNQNDAISNEQNFKGFSFDKKANRINKSLQFDCKKTKSNSEILNALHVNTFKINQQSAQQMDDQQSDSDLKMVKNAENLEPYEVYNDPRNKKDQPKAIRQTGKVT